MEPWRRLDLAAADEARALLARCCGSSGWVARMLARRPFGSDVALFDAARVEWFALDRADWLEAFAHHPMIGDRETLRNKFAATRALSTGEQAGVEDAPDAILDALTIGNRAYLERFGYIFIVCATGKSAQEMLALLEARLPNPPEVEIRIAAEEQAKISEIRLKGIA